jgi:hypothetical protein
LIGINSPRSVASLEASSLAFRSGCIKDNPPFRRYIIL